MLPPQSDSDPLLAFSIEPAAARVAPLPPSQPSQLVAVPVVSPPPAAPVVPRAEIERIHTRIDRLEKAVDQSVKDLRAVKSEVATLVGVTSDINKHIRRAATPDVEAQLASRLAQRASAVAGIVAGVAIGAWFYMSAGNDVAVPAPAPAVVEHVVQPDSASVATPATAATTQAAIVPTTAITPVRNAVARNAAYVGTLSIDADPDGNVFIDRKSAGRTPVRAEKLKAGSHLVWIERDGYRRFTRVVQVPADRVTRLVADLEPAPR